MLPAALLSQYPFFETLPFKYVHSFWKEIVKRQINRKETKQNGCLYLTPSIAWHAVPVRLYLCVILVTLGYYILVFLLII